MPHYFDETEDRMPGVAEHIKKYIYHIERHYGLSVTIHSHTDKFHLKFAEFNLHTNPYCLYIKTHDGIWDNCVNLQKKVTERCKCIGAFQGICHAGVLEYVYPIRSDTDVIGFISVSGYRPPPGHPLFEKAEEKLDAICRVYRLEKSEVKHVYDTHLSTEIPDKELIDTLIEPLCDMIRLDRADDSLIKNNSVSDEDGLYYAICNRRVR